MKTSPAENETLPPPSSPSRHWQRPLFLPLAALFISLIVTAVFWRNAENDADNALQAQIDARLAEITRRIEQHLDTQALILQGMAGLFNASDSVTREDFRRYSLSLQREMKDSGYVSMAYLVAVPRKELARHTARIRQEGFPQYTVSPESSRALYAPLVFLEPFIDANRNAMGFDTYSVDESRRALELAKDSGHLTATGKITLKQESNEKTKGFALYLPIYRWGTSVASLQERRTNHLGWVALSFRTAMMMKKVLGDIPQDFDYEIFESTDGVPTQILFDSDNVQRSFNDKYNGVHREKTLSRAGQSWSVAVHSLTENGVASARNVPRFVATTGILASLLLSFVLATLLHQQRRRVQLIAANATETQRRQDEFVLRDSEFAARLAVENARQAMHELKRQKYALDQHAIVATVNRQGKITYANDRFCEISGYSREELLGQDHILLNSGEHPKGFFKAMYETICSGKVWHGEVCNRAKGGRRYWVDTTVVPFLDEQGKPEQYIAIRSDISRRKLAEIAREESAEFIRKIAAQIPGCIYQFKTRANGSVCLPYASEGFYELHGVYPEEIREDAQKLYATIHPDDLAGVKASIRLSQESLTPWVHEYRVLSPDGSTQWLAGNALPQRESSGGTIWHGFISNVSARKTAEQELELYRLNLEDRVQQQTKGLQDSVEQTMRALSQLEQQKFVLDQHAIVTICGVDGRITYGNAKFSEISGYTADEFIGRDHKIVNSGVHPKGFFKKMYEAISRGEVWHSEVCNRTKNGELYWVDTTIAAFWGEDGQPREYIAVRTDITKRKLAEQAALAASRAKSEFLANMSHEIRTPMNGVVGMVDILEETELTPAQQRMVGTIHTASLALLNILNDILDYSKIEAGKLKLERIPTHLREVSEGVVQLLMITSGSKSIDLSVFVSPKLPLWILGDPTRLRQVLLNLLGNAVKFTFTNERRAGHVELRVEPSQLDDGSAAIKFRVIDNGIGIAPETLSTLFQPFTQGDESTARKFGGTGLGLSITHRLVEMMDGRIGAKSTYGEGTEFVVELPLEKSAAGRTLPDCPDLSAVHVLAVLDHLHCTEDCLDYCRSAGATVTRAASLAEAGKYLQAPQASKMKTILLLGLSTEEASITELIPPEINVLRLVKHNVRVAENDIFVTACPLFYDDLIKGLALTGGQTLPPDLTNPLKRRRRSHRLRAPSIEDARQSGRLILLAEDNETNREVMIEQLRLLGYTAEAAGDGLIALAMWRSGNYAMLLTDCHMPNMDGFELTSAIRYAEPDGTHLPIVAVTANAMEGEAQRCKERGMDDYLSKPLRLDELATMMTKWMPVMTNQNIRSGDSLNPSTANIEPIDLPVNVASAEDASSRSIPDWDAEMLATMIGDNPPMYRRLLESFLSRAAEQVSEIMTAVDNSDFEAAAKAAHKLKSSAHTVGAMQLAALCRDIEAGGRNGDHASCRSHNQKLGCAFGAAARAIKSHLEQNQS